MNEEGKRMWRVCYSAKVKIFSAGPSISSQEWEKAEFIDDDWVVVVKAGNKADAMQLGYDMIRAAICRQEAALKDIAQPEFEKAKTEQEQGPKWWDVCYSTKACQYSVREASCFITEKEKSRTIEIDEGCYRIFVQATDKRKACVEADFKIGQYILNIRQGMAMALRRAQREYFFNDEGKCCCGGHACGQTSSTIVGWSEPCETNNFQEVK